MVTWDKYLGMQALSRQGLAKIEVARRLRLDRHTVAKQLRAITGPPMRQKHCVQWSLLTEGGGKLKPAAKKAKGDKQLFRVLTALKSIKILDAFRYNI